MWYSNATNQDCKALQRVVRLAERISGSALPSLQESLAALALSHLPSARKHSLSPTCRPLASTLSLPPAGLRGPFLVSPTITGIRYRCYSSFTCQPFHRSSQNPLSPQRVPHSHAPLATYPHRPSQAGEPSGLQPPHS